MNREDFVVGKKYRTTHNTVCSFVGPAFDGRLIFGTANGCVFSSTTYKDYEEVHEPQIFYAVRDLDTWTILRCFPTLEGAEEFRAAGPRAKRITIFKEEVL